MIKDVLKLAVRQVLRLGLEGTEDGPQEDGCTEGRREQKVQ